VNDPMMTEEHQDEKDAVFGVSCLCPFGNYEGGELICWEMEVIVELKPGDLFFFPAHLVMHSNQLVKGERHSLVAFTQQGTINYYETKYNCVDERLIALNAKKQKPSQKKRALENEGAKMLKDEETKDKATWS
jgi:predicted 2-oxoglutarate/Fe(II)-dependent dioxygenase YbiX